MALTLDQYREQHPSFANVGDEALANHLHERYYSSMPFNEFASEIGYKPTPEPTPEADKPENTDGDTVRGFKDSFTQAKQLGYGLLAGAGAGLESMAGEGGYASGIKKAGVEGYREVGKDLEATAKPSDSLTYSLDQAKAGDLGALIDWTQHGIGNAIGQGVQGLATFGVGATAGKAALGVASKELVEGLVAKEAASIVAKQEAEKLAGTAVGEELAGDALTQVATSNVAHKFADIGAKSFVAGQAYGMESGEVGGELADKSEREGKPLTGSEAAKGLGWALAAGTVEFGGEMLGLNAIMGKSKLVNNITGFADETPGLLGRVQRGVAGGAVVAPVEGAQEAVQTIAENYGKGKDPFSEEGKRDIIDSAGQGFIGGGSMGGIGGIAKAATVDDAIKAAGDAVNAPQMPTIPETATADSPYVENSVDSKIPIGTDVQSAIDSQYTDTGYVPESIRAKRGFGLQSELADLAAVESKDKAKQVNGLLNEQALQRETEAKINVAIANPALATKSGFNQLSEFSNFANELANEKATAVDDLLGQQALRRESNLETLNNTLDEQRKQQTQAKRLAILNSVLEDESVLNKQDKFEAEIKRNGYNDTNLTPFEREHLGKHINFLSAKEALDQSQIPSSPNEQEFYEPQKAKKESKPTPESSGLSDANGAGSGRDILPGGISGAESVSVHGGLSGQSQGTSAEQNTDNNGRELQQSLSNPDAVVNKNTNKPFFPSQKSANKVLTGDVYPETSNTHEVVKVGKMFQVVPKVDQQSSAEEDTIPVNTEDNHLTTSESPTINGVGESEHAGYKIYPTTVKGKEYFAVQSRDNKTSDRTFGDTLHETLDDAKKQAEFNAKKDASEIETKKHQDEQASNDEEVKQEHNDIDGFGDNLKPFEKGRIAKALSKQVRINGKVDSIKNHVRNKVANGESTSSYEEDRIKPMSNKAWFRANQQEQDEHNRKVKEGGKYTIYQVGGHDLGKTAHDYANHLIENKSNSEQINKSESDKNEPEISEADLADFMQSEQGKPLAQQLSEVRERISAFENFKKCVGG